MRQLFLTILLLAATQVQANANSASSAAVERLAAQLTGTFSNAEQATGSKHYPHVVLHVVRIWPERHDGPWLYAEQALAEAIDQPYRQHLYQIAAGDDGGLALHTFTLLDPIAATGAWRQPAPLDALGRKAPIPAQPSCTLYFQEMPDQSFVGTTRGNGCLSNLRGASYATSELTAAADGLTLWERGFTASGRQVWGPSAGGYRLKRLATP